jgi:hypothetical protein
MFMERMQIKAEAMQRPSLNLPKSISESASFDFLGKTRELLLSIKPETSNEDAAFLLKNASFLYYLDRSLQGIQRSCSHDLKKSFSVVLSCAIDDDIVGVLRDTYAALKDSEPIADHEEGHVQRTKAAFSLYMACNALACT